MTDDTKNTTDSTRGQHLRQRVEARRAELEAARDGIPEATRERGEIEFALAELASLMTGDLEHIPHVVARDLNKWLETHKHVSEHHTGAPGPASDAASDDSAESPATTPANVDRPSDTEWAP